MSGAASVRAGLRRRWLVAVVVLALAVAGGTRLVAALTMDATAVRWAVVAGGVAVFELAFLRYHLDANHAEGASALYDGLGIANGITLARGAAYAGVAGFALVPSTPTVAWAPALLYGGGVVLDWVDGFVARRRDRTTLLGAKLDLAFDTLGFLVAPVVAVLWGHLPVWYLSLSAARYLFKAGTGYRRYRGRPVGDLPESRVRRPLAGVQMVFIAVALSPVLSPATLRPLAAVVLVPSLAVFVRDYFAVSGRLSRGN